MKARATTSRRPPVLTAFLTAALALASVRFVEAAEARDPHVTTDKAGTWLAVWSSDDNLGPGIDDDILLARSTNGGATWSTPSILNGNAANDADDSNPRLSTDGTGHWVAVWHSNDSLGGTIGSDDDILIARSGDNGATWSAPSALNSNAGVDSGGDYLPQVTTDGSGSWVAVWFSYDTLGGTVGGEGDILVARSSDNGATWTAPAALNNNAATDSGSDRDPQIVSDHASNWIAVWSSSDTLGGTIGSDDDVLIARSTDGGTTWTAPAALNTNASGDSADDLNPFVASDGLGKWVAIWYSVLDTFSGLDGTMLVSRSDDDASTWTAPATIDADAGVAQAAYAPQVATDGTGNWLAVWPSELDLSATDLDDADIFVARSTDAGATWSSTGVVNANYSSGGSHYSPQLATDDAGNWVSAWRYDNGIATRPDRVMVSHSNDVGATWTEQAILDTPIAICGDGPLDPASCFSATRTKLQLSNSGSPGRDKLSWQWSRGDAFAFADLGQPRVRTDYTLCVYDSESSAPVLASSLVIADSSPYWSSKGTGLEYRESSGAADGVVKLQMKPGEPERTKIKLLAKGEHLVLPTPVGATYFTQTPNVVAQLRSSDGECWTSEFLSADTAKNEADGFRAAMK